MATGTLVRVDDDDLLLLRHVSSTIQGPRGTPRYPCELDIAELRALYDLPLYVWT